MGIGLHRLLANVNSRPIHHLGRSHVFYHLLPPELGLKYGQLSRYGFLFLLALIYFMPGALSIILLPAISMLRLVLSLMGPFILVPFGVV